MVCAFVAWVFSFGARSSASSAAQCTAPWLVRIFSASIAPPLAPVRAHRATSSMSPPASAAAWNIARRYARALVWKNYCHLGQVDGVGETRRRA